MMLIMITVAGQWIRVADRDTGLGPWLDGIRHRALLGTTTIDADVDHEQAALDAYNARLALLNGPAATHAPECTRPQRPSDRCRAPTRDRTNLDTAAQRRLPRSRGATMKSLPPWHILWGVTAVCACLALPRLRREYCRRPT
nr:hypothetical protein [Nocardia nova]